MDGIRTIERKFRRTPVRLIDHEGVNGVLRLRGRKSLLEVSSDDLFHPPRDDADGWFDLIVRAQDGRDLLLHHAVDAGSRTHHWGDERNAHYARVYPNIVVDDMRGLSADRQVQSVSFRLGGMDRFFNYRHSESLRTHGATDEQIAVLRSMRYGAAEAGGDDDRGSEGEFAPHEVYVVHRMPRFVDFRVDDRRYTVWAGGSFSGLNWDRVDARIFPIATIEFDAPVGIEEALDRVWEWRRLFAQLSMRQLAIKGISVRGSLERRAPSANVYLPNLERPPKSGGRRGASAVHMPLNTWGERGELSDAMRTWLARDGERRRFRVRLDRVLDRMNRRIDPSDLVDLAAAVDGLAEVAAAAAVTGLQVEAMVTAAHAAAEAAAAGVNRSRIAGLLGGLSRPSLSMRMTALAAGLSPPPSAEEVSLVVSSATRVRNATAHGGAIDAQVQPRVAPTIQAVTAMYARYDLETCGFPSRTSHDARTVTKVQFDEGLAELQGLVAPATSS